MIPEPFPQSPSLDPSSSYFSYYLSLVLGTHFQLMVLYYPISLVVYYSEPEILAILDLFFSHQNQILFFLSKIIRKVMALHAHLNQSFQVYYLNWLTQNKARFAEMGICICEMNLLNLLC